MENEDTTTIRSAARSSHKRTHEQMLEEDRRLEQSQRRSTSIQRYPNAPSASLNRIFPPPPLVHFPGDGLDFRRPVMSLQPPRSDVIDLTLESESPPRPLHRPQRRDSPPADFTVIDLDDETDGSDSADSGEWESDGRDGRDTMHGASEVEFLSSRPRHMTQQPITDYANRQPARNPSWLRESSGRPALGTQNEEQQRQARQAQNRPTSAISNFIASAFNNHLPRVYPFNRPSNNHNRDFGLAIDLAIDDESTMRHFPPFHAPALDFDAVAFDLGRNDPAPAPAPPRPTYQAPPAPPEGFTRSPAEEDVVICPNCDCELGQGDDELKRQVWVIRNCGHVYCGQCAKHRAKRGKAAANRTTKPFAYCVVEGCGKMKLSGPKAMFNLYISA